MSDVFEELWFVKPGQYAPKRAVYKRLSGTTNPQVLLLEFEVPLRPDMGPGTATMCVPISDIDAVGILANLMEAQQQGKIPQFATPERLTDVN